MTLQVEILESSFEKIKPQANEFVSSFYNHLFTDYPEAKPLFEGTDMEKQGGKLLQSLVLVIENLRKPDALSNALKGLGARHVKYGALPEHYPLVGATLLKTFDEYLGDAWTEEVQTAWVDAYGAITTIMLDGADYSEADVQLKPEAPPNDSGLQVELLETSFAQVKPVANEFADRFYENLFTDYPAAQPLFANTDIKQQSKKLLQSLVLVVENLRKPDALGDALTGLGARHVQYGALPEHYPLVGNTLLKTFGQFLGPAWTDEVQQAWVDAYGAISTIMLDGADYSEADIQLEPETPASPDDSGLQVELLETSFAQVKPVANEFADRFYENLFTDYPAAQPLFANTDIKQQSKKLLQSLVLVVENLRKPDALGDALTGLGARHVKYGALPEHYPLVGNTLLKTFEEFLGSAWTDEVKQAWVDAYGAISTIMLDGADYSQADLDLNSAPPASSSPSSFSSEAAETDRPTGLLLGLAGGGIVAVIIAILLV
ncbi:globin family protein [Acaryochloris sp. CCMEE 5410]|uniref:globin family protein n=1 Tax=Acaryochloris sp. CCMEE 5410 TaxID=310037 RepID=UPI00024838DF|nr:globin family protein [Acaryochloris sp. CCMEE 5410]KAI9133472.1 hypothetical protein ON05_009245 [Acaryochloris sp. CCMEE 5410]